MTPHDHLAKEWGGLPERFAPFVRNADVWVRKHTKPEYWNLPMLDAVRVLHANYQLADDETLNKSALLHAAWELMIPYLTEDMKNAY